MITRSQLAMMAAVSVPESWPQLAAETAQDIVRLLFADAVKVVLRVSALFAFVAAAMALLYRREDAQ